MIEVQQYDRLSYSYPDLIRTTLDYGTEVESRAGKTKEFIGFALCLTEPAQCLVKRRGFSHKFMHTEILLLLAGEYDDELIRSVTPKAADLLAPATAYGPRIWPQIGYVEQELREHSDSRRGVIYVGRHQDLQTVVEPYDEVEEASVKGEMPCTETLQFLLRANKLHLIVSMRSWDLIWGLCYDIPNFVALQMAMARALGVSIGEYYHMAGSAHIYEQHWDLVPDRNERQAGELHLPWLRNDLYSTRRAAQEIVKSMKEALNVRS